jgi:hypothetical protein
LHHHSETQLKRKEPGIQQLVRKYNKLCSQMVEMKEKRQAPLGAVVPHTIDKDGLFNIDVDDDIWQDVGLHDLEDEMQGSIPLWLGDDDVRKGIRSLLELDRCEEEERRLSKELWAMHDWMIEEWTCVTKAMEISGMNITCF